MWGILRSCSRISREANWNICFLSLADFTFELLLFALSCWPSERGSGKVSVTRPSTMTIMALNNSTSPQGSTEASGDGCQKPQQVMYESVFGIFLAMPQWEAIGTAVILSLIIIVTIVGNILVILSVFTYKPLRIVQNFFIVSLAVADLTVAILVLPFNVAYSIRGRWDFGIHICKMWLTCDVLCCTASILNLCAIALDRYVKISRIPP